MTKYSESWKYFGVTDLPDPNNLFATYTKKV